jgi:hypothetical protein
VRSHAGRVRFRYLDVTDSALSGFPEDVRELARDEARLPLTVVDGAVIFTGAFSPSRIDYEIRRQLANRWPGKAPGGAARERRVTAERLT